jgi:hypothetical protein
MKLMFEQTQSNTIDVDIMNNISQTPNRQVSDISSFLD